MISVKFIKYATAVLVLAAALASCNKDTEPAGENGDMIFNIGFAPQTRALTDAQFNSVWENGDQVGIFAVPVGQGLSSTASENFINNAKLTCDNGTWIPETPLWWPSGGNSSLDFYAYYPYDASATDPGAILFRVLTDQGSTTEREGARVANYNLSDLLTAGTSAVVRGQTVNLYFDHALAMVQVTVDNTDIPIVDPDVAVTLRGVKTGAVLDLGGVSGPEAVCAPGNNDVENITMYRVEQPGDADYSQTFTFRALVPAQAVEEGSSLFWINSGGQLFESSRLDNALTLQAGRAELFGQTPAFNYALYITDPVFRQYCLDNFDTEDSGGNPGADGRLSLAELEAVTSINVNNGYNGNLIETLEGIKYFTNLQTLDCGNNLLTSLDLSGCESLRTLTCYANSLEMLTVQGCVNLQTINCNNNSLSTLVLTRCNNLQSLNCSNNSLGSLNLSGYTNLQTLGCDNNPLSTLVLTGCSNLRNLNCSYTSLTSLDLSYFVNLRSMSCDNNSNLESLYLTGCTNLQSLYCSYTRALTLNVANCENLERIYCSYSRWLETIDLTGCRSLEMLDCQSCYLWSLDIKDCVKLETLFCQYNLELEELDVSLNQQLSILRCGNVWSSLTVWTSPSQILSPTGVGMEGRLAIMVLRMDDSYEPLTAKYTTTLLVTVKDK